MDSTAKQNWKCTLIKIVLKFSENFGKLWNLGKCFLQNLWAIIFREILCKFSDNLRKIWKSTENLTKTILD